MKQCTALFVLLIIIWCVPLWAEGEETAFFALTSQQQEVAPGDPLSFMLSLDGNSGKKVSTFRIRVTYEKSKLEFRGLQAEGETGEKDYRFHEKDNELIIIFLSDGTGVAMDGAGKDLLSLRFLVKEGVSDGETGLQAVVDGVGTSEIQEIQPGESLKASALVVTPDYSLAALEPDTGRLTPGFQPDVMAYSLEVAYSVDRITFYASPVNEEAQVKISRKTLEGAGSTTEIQITVRSPDEKIQKTYVVAVVRQEKPQGQGISPGGRTSGSDRTSRSSSKASSRTAWKDEEAVSSETLDQEEYGTPHQASRSGLLQKEDHMGAFLIGGAIFLVIAFVVVLMQRARRKETPHNPPEENEEEEKGK